MYDSSNMSTGANVIKCMELGMPFQIMIKAKVSKDERIVLTNQGSVKNDTLAKAIRHAHLIICSNKCLRDTKDDE